MGRFLLFSCLTLGLIGLAAPVCAADCPAFKAPHITVVPLSSRPTFDLSRSLSDMQIMVTSQRDDFSSTEHETPVGLTAAQLKLDSHFEVLMSRPTAMDEICAQISDFELRFGFQDTTVYLAHELPQGSCSFKTVLLHEQRHVDMDTYLVRTYAERFPNMLRDAVTDIGTVRARSAEEAQAKLRDIVHKYMSDLGASLTQVRQRYQQTIDTKDEYSRISTSCDGELGGILQRATPQTGVRPY